MRSWVTAVIAQRERETIASARGRHWQWPANGSQSKARPLATPNSAAALRRAGRGNTAAIAAVGAAADKRAEDLRETIMEVVASGSHAAIAAELNRREIEALRGGRWHPMGVARLRQRLQPVA